MTTGNVPAHGISSRVPVHVERWGWYSILVNVVLAGLHAIVAARSGSLAVAAELVHNLVDLLAAVAVLAGLRIAVRSSAAFPYGLYKVENLVAAGLAIMVFVSAWEIARHALLAPPSAMQADAWMLLLLLATTAIPLVFSHFELRAGLAANSPALVADAREYRVHVFTTGLALLALLSQWLGMPLDRYAAVLIVVAVVKTGWGLLRDAMRVLLDASLDAATLELLRDKIMADPAVAQISWVTGRNAGRFCFVEAGLVLRVEGQDRIATVVRRIESTVRAAVPCVERLLVHVEAPISSDTRYALPLDDTAGAVSRHFGDAPWFAFVTVNRASGEIVEHRVQANPFLGETRARGLRVAEWLVAQKVDVVLAQEELSGKGPAYVLHDAGVELRHARHQQLSEVLDDLRSRARRE